MKCKRFKIEQLKNEEWFQFYTEFKLLVEEYLPAALDIETLFPRFVELYSKANQGLEVVRKSTTTELLAEADNKRDNIFRGFSDAVKSAQNHFDTKKREAAQRLLSIFDHYGNITQEGYDEETSLIHIFLREMNGSRAVDISMLGLGDWVKQLEADNNAFDGFMRNRSAENPGKTNLRMKHIRAEIDRCYREILDRVDALIIVNGPSKYSGFVKELSMRADRFNNIITQRKGRNAGIERNRLLVKDFHY